MNCSSTLRSAILVLATCLSTGAVAGCTAGTTEAEDTRALESAVSGGEWVARLYRDVLGREGEPEGMSFWTGVHAGGAPRFDIAMAFLDSDEARRNRVTWMYQNVLQRDPDPEGYEWHLNRLRKGVPTTTELAVFFASEEYFVELCYEDDYEYVYSLYTNLLGRDPSDEEVTGWLESGADRFQLAQHFIHSEEMRGNVVRFYYAFYLHREAEPSGFEAHMNALRSGWSHEQVAAGFLSSDEYYDMDPGAAPAPVGGGGSCGAVTDEGECQGNVAVYCDAGELVADDCAAYGETCDAGYCGGGVDPDPQPGGGSCGAIDEVGVCQGTVVSYCDAGELVSYDCADDGTSCGDVGGYFDCL